LLLRRPEQGRGLPLPWLAFPVAGAILGWQVGGPRLAAALSFAPGPWWLLPAAAAVAGASVGALAGRPLNRLLGGFFRLFNVGFGHAINGYVRLVGGLLRISAVVLVL